MRFRFCGDLDCPDWVLAEIQTLSKLSSVKFKLVCAQVVKSLVHAGGGTASSSSSSSSSASSIDLDKIAKLCSDAKLEWSDVKAAVAALDFIVANAAKHAVDADQLGDEIQQLGLPKEHAVGLGKVYSDHASAIRSRQRDSSLKLSSLEKVDWRVDCVLGSSAEPESSTGRPEVRVRLDVRDADTSKLTPVGFSMDADQCRLLLAELTAADKIMRRVAAGGGGGSEDREAA